MLIMDRFTLFFTGIVTLCAIGTVLIADGYLKRFGMDRCEFYSMLFFSTLGMVVLVLAAWGSFCASAGLWLGTVAKTEAQAGGLGVLAANGLAALGGCWWPIEITPDWMQTVQTLIPTGWTMDALHKLISFQSGAQSAIPDVVLLFGAATVLGWLAVRKFEYQ